MEKRDAYNKIIEKYEGKYIKENAELHKKCLQDLIADNRNYIQRILNLYGDYEARFNTTHIEILKEKKDIFLFYKILEKYKYNVKLAILWFLSDIASSDYEPTEKYFMSLYENSPYIEKIEKKGNSFIIHSIIGKIHFKKIKDYLNELNNQKLEAFYEEECIPGYCHFNTTKAVKITRDSTAITALCKAAFTGTYYHSFTLHNGNCIDFNFACVIPYEEYTKLLDANIINEISHNHLKEELSPFQDLKEPLFYKAIDVQAQK